MKTQFWITAILVTFLIASGQVNASEEVSKHQVPKTVLEAFDKAYPNAKEVEFEKEMIEGKEYEILYDSDGAILQKEETIDVKSLPEGVVQAIFQAHPKATIEEAKKVMKHDGTATGYEVEIKTEGKELELELDTYGKILKTEQE